MWLFSLFIFSSIFEFGSAFIVGGCIGPKSSFERYLTVSEKKELKRIVHENFDGSNQAEVLSEVYHFVHGHVTDAQWKEIYPEIEKYRQQSHECSVYAQLLPNHLYKQLLTSVYRASETGADKHEVKRLVEEYIERLLVEGALDRIPTQMPALKPALPMSPVVRRVSQTSKPTIASTPFESTTTSAAQQTTISAVPVRPAHYLVMAPPPPVRITLRPPLSINLLLSTSTPTTTTLKPTPPIPFAGLSQAMEETRNAARFDSLARQFLRERIRIASSTQDTPVVYNNVNLPPPPSMPPPLYNLFPRAIPLNGAQRLPNPYGSNHERLSNNPTFPLVSMNPYFHCPSSETNCCHYCTPAYWHRQHHRRPALLVEPWDERKFDGNFQASERKGYRRTFGTSFPRYNDVERIDGEKGKGEDKEEKGKGEDKEEKGKEETTTMKNAGEESTIVESLKKSENSTKAELHERHEKILIPLKNGELIEPDGWDLVESKEK
ncbi:unnamed protein product, partial [Mesorhabditis belari]|uniref:Uncharacterized protein n=1 Tax=Mesorhabditis belari TaxID=2138241 RepID=A0AAF3EWL7_9BILA